MTSGESKVQCEQLDTGYEFSPISYDLNVETISEYMEAVGESSSLFRQQDNPEALTGLIPPTAIATYAMKMLLQRLSLPAGSIHASQELEFVKATEIGSRIRCQAKVIQKWQRGKFHFLTIDLSVLDQNKELIQSGKVGLILPD